MLPDKDTMCHRTNFTLSCRELVSSDKCKRWYMIQGEHPQTGEMRQNWRCIDDHIPELLLNLGRSQDQTTKTLGKMHNTSEVRHAEVVGIHRTLAEAMAQTSIMLGFAPGSETKLIEERKAQ